VRFNSQKSASILKSRYIDFKMDADFWELKRTLERNNKLCGERYLDYTKQSGTRQKFYSTEIYKEFDKRFERRKI